MFLTAKIALVIPILPGLYPLALELPALIVEFVELGIGTPLRQFSEHGLRGKRNAILNHQFDLEPGSILAVTPGFGKRGYSYLTELPPKAGTIVIGRKCWRDIAP
jgi:hypothetical protein